MEDFIKEVNKAIDKGYKPIGGITITTEDLGHRIKEYFYQAIYKDGQPT